MSVRETMQSLLLREYSTGSFLQGHEPNSYTGYQNHFLSKKFDYHMRKYKKCV